MRRLIALGAVTFGSGLALLACVDLFHSTDVDAVEANDSAVDQAVPDVRVDAPVDAGHATTGPIDFCAADGGDNTALARHACALLAACESPLGTNSTGECLEHALPAMACKSAPNHPVSGEALAFYRCIAAADRCAPDPDAGASEARHDIAGCVFPVGAVPKCGPGTFTACGFAADGQKDVRVDCEARPDASVRGESCSALGKTCIVTSPVTSTCGDPVGSADGGVTCAKTGCNGTHLELCGDGTTDGGVNRGFDCKDFGGGTCTDGNAGFPECAPSNSGAPCTPTAAVRCSKTAAIGCPNGLQEIVDCAALVAGATCTEISGGTRAQAWDVGRACTLAVDAGACTEDTCSATHLIACVRGRPVNIDCQAEFGSGSGCQQIGTGDGYRAACKAP